ncbi:MAG: aldehyde dehydrogenase family protein [Myxococcales bacterium]|nr:aldehyde dehydrogenase family protein [Myxococcales bacterium]USN51805.1 MAG: aldehyde dehydrogenase family protein [Myxococcales bacterium]
MNPHESLIAPVLKQLRDSHHSGVLLSIDARRSALRKLLTAIDDNEVRITKALKYDLGKSSFESYVCEIAFIKEEIKSALASIGKWSQKRFVPTPITFQPGQSYIQPSPKGVVLIIAPWNYPFQLSLAPLVCTIAAGNCALIKPSELAAASEQVIHDLIHDYLDKNCFRVLNGDMHLASALTKTPFDHIFYTGSTEIGKIVMENAAKNLTPVTLELGGKCPVIIDDNVDIDLAAKRIMWAKSLNAGQTCIAPDYVLINKNLIPAFVKAAKKYLEKMFGTNPENSPDYGRIINQRHTERLINYLPQARIACGGKYNVTTRFIEPTILIDVHETAPVMQEEIFGPILPLIEIKNIDNAINKINQRNHPLALYIFSKKQKTIKNICDQTLSGSVAINDCISQVAIGGLPFGGVRHSGIGSYHGQFGFETFSHMRAVHKRANILDNPIKYPPYSKAKLNIARLVL